MDQTLIAAYVAEQLKIAQSRAGLTNAEVSKRLRLTGVDIPASELATIFQTGEMSAALFLRMLLTLERDSVSIRGLDSFLRAFDCPECSPYRPLPKLSVDSQIDYDEPIPF